MIVKAIKDALDKVPEADQKKDFLVVDKNDIDQRLGTPVEVLHDLINDQYLLVVDTENLD